MRIFALAECGPLILMSSFPILTAFNKDSTEILTEFFQGGLYVRGGYRAGFGVLLISAMLCLATLTVARVWHPRPHKLEESSEEFLETKGFSKAVMISVSKRSTEFALFYTVFGVGGFWAACLWAFSMTDRSSH
jgi:hypothetical protein